MTDTNSEAQQSDAVDHPPQESTNASGLGSKSIISSVFAGLLGVQSDKNREKDFKQGRASDYIIFGVIGVVLLVVTMGVIVSTVMP